MKNKTKKIPSGQVTKNCVNCVYFDDRDLPKWKTGNCLYDNSDMKPNHRGPNSVCENWRGK